MRLSPLARPLTAVVAAVLVAGALAACTTSGSDSDCSQFAPGDTSNAVTVSGEVGGTPVVDLPTPLIANEVQRTVAVAGEGDRIESGAAVLVSYTYYEGASGGSVTESTGVYTASDVNLALGESLVCARPGSRLVLAGPAEDIDAQYAGTSDTLVAVVDIQQVFLGKANGINQLPLDGMPTVVTAVDGTPGLALGYQADVAEPRAATIKAGGGSVVKEGDVIVFQARLFTWSSPTATEATVSGQPDSWSTGRAFVQAPTLEFLGDQTLVDAIVGAKVGSQLLVVIPDAGGTGTTNAFVIDILGIATTD
ncbi:hypothetical protein [Pseudolysinimonas sp.]